MSGMSLYNMLCGQHPLLPVFVIITKVGQSDLPRLRDAYITADATKIVFFARMGGGNREAYKEALDAIKKHPLYVRDFDDDYDNTYCHIEFNVPGDPDSQGAMKLAVEKFGSEKPMDRFQRLMKLMQEHEPGTAPTPEVANAMRVGEAIISQVTSLPAGHRGEVSNEHGGVVLVSGGTGAVNIESKDSK